jgi:uncharacterized membrane protein YtjA (UPF0391 family)
MLKRARISMLVALVGGFFGFTGVLHWTAVIAQGLFYFCCAFSVLSLLLSLFEERNQALSVAEEVRQQPTPVQRASPRAQMDPHPASSAV